MCNITSLMFLFWDLQLRCKNSDDGVIETIETPQYDHIFDNSEWPVGKMLTLGNKDEFINMLLREKLLTKRTGSLNSLCGLNYFGLVDKLKKPPNVGEQLFTHQEETDVTAQGLIYCLLIEKPSKPEEVATVNNLMTFIEKCENDTGMLTVV